MKKEKERRKVWKEIRIESEKTKERKARRRGGNKEEERERELNQSLIQEDLGKEEVGTKALKNKGEERKRILLRYQRPETTCVYQSNSKQDGLTWLGKFGNQVKKG
jgi:hypothetical protein